MQTGSNFDYENLCQESQSRWLKNPEVLFILQNHESFPIEQKPPDKPPSGSLLLFNRRVLRFFRRDGHMWRKKKDGRAVGEAHERLKVENVDALNCYYAHGEENPFFRRRIYWMLDPAYDHIVLVHYREISEGRFLPPTGPQQPQEQLSSLNGSSGVNNVQFQGAPYDTSKIHDSYQSSSSPISGEVSSKYVGENFDTYFQNITSISGNCDPSSRPEVSREIRELEEQLSLDKFDDNILGDILPPNTTEYKKLDDPALQVNKAGSSFFHEKLMPSMECAVYDGQNMKINGYHSIESIRGFDGKQKSHPPVLHHGIERNNSPSWNDMLEFSSSSTGISAHGAEPSCHTTIATGTYHCIGNAFKHGSVLQQFHSEKENIIGVPFDQLEKFSWRQPDHAGNNTEHMASGSDLSSQLSEARRFLLGSDSLDSPNADVHLATGELCNISGITSVGSNPNVGSVQNEKSIEWMGTIDLPGGNTAYSSAMLGMWFDQGQHGTSFATETSLTVAQKQLFSIREISPEWSFSFQRTKVIITGDFLCSPSAYSWAVMFGEIEVPAEIVQQGVLRCQAPEHATGNVTLCITSGNRESCSEVRDFEFCMKPVNSSMKPLHHVNAAKNAEELLLLSKFVHALLCRSDDFSVLKGAGLSETEYPRKSKIAEEQWLQIQEQLQAGSQISSGTIDWIFQELIKDKFQQWILTKTNAKEGINCLLSKEEQCIIHIISGLGYEWALNPILDTGVGINFRDSNGWTALHWAAHFGREKMAAALLAAGALAGAVTDPTTQDPVGKTAGAMAAACGHKGLAGYLSEADLTSHLSSLTMEKCEISKDSALAEAEKAVESISERSAQLHGGTADDPSLKDSLAAVRNAAQAAARIQAAFRAHSFRKRQEEAALYCDEYGMTSEDIQGLSASSKVQRVHGYRGQKYDKAALSIQKKYRGWKGRKGFLTLRQHVVKIQAHVRGHQVRNKYKEFLWTVGVLEKVVLRWRRKGVGLRGFRLEHDLTDEKEEGEDIAKVFRKQKVDAALEQAFSRVLSMVESPTARQQYRRMLESYHEAKAEQGSAKEALSRLQDNFEMMQDVDFLHWLESNQ